uniref:Uncharacterized protein n=1 Tax=Anguilla anguilla TaxID=7936 RepID=A0A0E9RH65_ANGAN
MQNTLDKHDWKQNGCVKRSNTGGLLCIGVSGEPGILNTESEPAGFLIFQL